MPDDRPSRPVRLNLAPKPRNRPSSKKPKTTKRTPAPKRRPPKDDSTLLYWFAGVLIVLLLALIAAAVEVPQIKAWIAQLSEPKKETSPYVPLELPDKSKPNVTASSTNPSKPANTPKPQTEQDRLKALKQRADLETQKLVEQSVPKPVLAPVPAAPAVKPVPSPAPVVAPLAPTPKPATASTEPPVVQPVPMGAINGAPARALPLDPNKLDTERIAAYQVALERMHFSCGFIDGDQGMRTQRMLRAYQTSKGLPTTGFLDQPTRDAIGEPGEPFLSYVVTADDVASIMPKPPTWKEKSLAKRLGYNDIWEMLAEKFHCTRGYLKALNKTVTQPIAGTEVIGPKVYPAAPIPKAASLRVNLGEASIEGLDASGKIIAFFPCSIAKDKNKRPNGALTVKSVVPNPDYTFDPALFADAAKAEGITRKMVLPPGPRNPVGTAWVGLSLPGYGMHGTPEPENISRTQSHGCFRLANWNAEKVLKMVKVGTPIDVQP